MRGKLLADLRTSFFSFFNFISLSFLFFTLLALVSFGTLMGTVLVFFFSVWLLGLSLSRLRRLR